jgi:hypothetical protein
MTTICFLVGTLFGFVLGLVTSLWENQWYWRGVRRTHDDGTAADRRED